MRDLLLFLFFAGMLCVFGYVLLVDPSLFIEFGRWVLNFF